MRWRWLTQATSGGAPILGIYRVHFVARTPITRFVHIIIAIIIIIILYYCKIIAHTRYTKSERNVSSVCARAPLVFSRFKIYFCDIKYILSR